MLWIQRLCQGLTAAAVLLALGGPALAHPHVFVTVETTLLYEGGAFTGFQHKWTFDEFYSAMAIEGLDTNKDGQYSREELAELAKVNATSMKDFNYFTNAELAGKPLKLADARDYWLEHKDGLLALHFTVPLASPVLREAEGLTFSVYDPSFFIAFDLAKTERPLRLDERAPADCTLTIGVPEKGSRGGVSALNEQLSAITGFSGGPKTAAVKCGGPVATRPTPPAAGPPSATLVPPGSPVAPPPRDQPVETPTPKTPADKARVAALSNAPPTSGPAAAATPKMKKKVSKTSCAKQRSRSCATVKRERRIVRVPVR
jgi:ABC-type uncharacterized transport system substrate-binding protein